MVGMFVVKPKNLAPVDKELWITQQEYYIGKPGQDADMAKMAAKKPDVIAFNGYANQYKDNPISVKPGEKVRMYVLNAGPSIWSAFHVIGTVFDRTVVEGTVGHDAQTINLAPSQGGWVEFTLAEEGGYPFVTHAFGDMVKGALGVIKTPNAPERRGGHDMGPARAQPAAGRAGQGRCGRRQRDARRHVGQGRQDRGRGRQGHVRGQERGRDDARDGDGAAARLGAGRDARRDRHARQGQGARGRRSPTRSPPT